MNQLRQAFIVLSSISLTSCIWEAKNIFVQPEYPGELPPSVILDNQAQNSKAPWLQTDPEALPAPQSTIEKLGIRYAEDGTPYALQTEFKNIITSPYYPHPQLSHKSMNPGTKVWDPYSRKPLYLP